MSSLYGLNVRDTSQECPDCCEMCQSEVATLKAYSNTSAMGVGAKTHESHKWLCLLCASTMAGTACEYPNQFRSDRDYDILATICFVGNAIIEEIRKSKGVS